MSTCEQALDVLMGATYGLMIDELLDQIVRRNVMEALGRSKDQRALPALIGVLTCAEAVINVILALIRIGWIPDKNGEMLLLSFLDGEMRNSMLWFKLAQGLVRRVKNTGLKLQN